MSTNFDFLAAGSEEVFTEENYSFADTIAEKEVPAIDYENAVNYRLWPISFLEDTVMAISVFCVGMVLNSIILRCYWRGKGATSIYYRAFSVIDMFFLVVMILRRVSFFIWPAKGTYIFFEVMNNLMGTTYNFGSLFLAMDRCLIVAFPHNFREHEGKLRAAKGSMVFAMLVLSLAFSFAKFNLSNSFVISIINRSLVIAMFVQIFGIVVLYSVIIAKVQISDRKMKTSRHIGKQ